MGNAISPVGGMGGAPAFEYYQANLGAEGTSGQIDTYRPPENSGIFQKISDFFASGIARLAQGFASSPASAGFGCSSSGSIGYIGPTEPTMPPPPPPPQEEPEKPTYPDCEIAIESLRTGNFKVVQVQTISEKGFFFVGTTPEKNSNLSFVLSRGGRGELYYPSDKGYKIAEIFNSSKNPMENIECPKKDTIYFPSDGAITPLIDKFISDEAKNFTALRKNSQYGSAGKAPEQFDWVLSVLNRLEKIGLAQDAGTSDDPRQKFKSVGIEVLTDERGQKEYYLIYRHVRDFQEKNPPAFFIVLKSSPKKKDVFLFVHNYNEDLKKYYVGPLEGAEAIPAEGPEKTETKKIKIIPGLKFKYHDLPDYALRCGPHHPINEGQNLREEFQKIDQGKGDGFIEQKETQLDEKEFNRLKTKVSEFKELVVKKSQDCDRVGSQLDPFKINKIHLARKEILKLAKIPCTQDCD